jgi:hypothetical protein
VNRGLAHNRACGLILLAFYVADLLLTGVAIAVFSNRSFDPLVRATGGLINDTLVVNLLGVVVLVGGVILWLGRMRQRTWASASRRRQVRCSLWRWSGWQRRRSAPPSRGCRRGPSH